MFIYLKGLFEELYLWYFALVQFKFLACVRVDFSFALLFLFLQLSKLANYTCDIYLIF